MATSFMNTFAKSATVVLVHGAWADGSSWSQLVVPLKDAGLGVVCAPIPLTSLSDDIAAVSRVVEKIEGPVLLGGHAYGGAPIAGVTSEKLRGLVYIAALAPAEGETVAEVFYREKPHPKAPQIAHDAQRLYLDARDGLCRRLCSERYVRNLGHLECHSKANQRELHSGESPRSSVEVKALLVFGGRRRPDDCAENSAFHGGTNEDKHSLSPCGPYARHHGTRTGP
jgi:pimeloyl-ACP methyl ester carboxylesterase